MDLKTAIVRAQRGLRDDLRLYLVAVSSLAVAFLCLGAALLVVANLSAVETRWGNTGRLSIYLVDGAPTEDVEKLRTVLEGLGEVRSVELLTTEEARARFLEHAQIGTELGALPPEAFPSSLEVELASGVPVQRIDAIAGRVGRFGAVEDVETYRGWFERLDSLLLAGRGMAGALAVLVLVCVVAVVGNTIRLAVAGRRDEIEVMKLCGATDTFVRRPFVLEGAFQGLVAAGLALVLLLGGFLLLRGTVDSTVSVLTGVRMVFLHPAMVLGMVVGGATIGALGSALSLRRYLMV
ncbi:MAG: cell division protein FtsX [Myxococcota bacterium]